MVARLPCACVQGERQMGTSKPKVCSHGSTIGSLRDLPLWSFEVPISCFKIEKGPFRNIYYCALNKLNSLD